MQLRDSQFEASEIMGYKAGSRNVFHFLDNISIAHICLWGGDIRIELDILSTLVNIFLRVYARFEYPNFSGNNSLKTYYGDIPLQTIYSPF